MKTLQDFVNDVRQSMVHKCTDHCKAAGAGFTSHDPTGGAIYDKLADIPAVLDKSINKKAQALFDAQAKQ